MKMEGVNVACGMCTGYGLTQVSCGPHAVRYGKVCLTRNTTHHAMPCIAQHRALEGQTNSESMRETNHGMLADVRTVSASTPHTPLPSHTPVCIPCVSTRTHTLAQHCTNCRLLQLLQLLLTHPHRGCHSDCTHSEATTQLVAT